MLLAGCVIGGLTPVSTADLELPVLGQNSALQLQREDRLGRALYQRLRQNGYVIEDPLLSRYLSDIGESLLSGLNNRFRDYRFYLVKNRSVNAFATPGGYIGINLGLIAMTQNEDELAAVIAHEIAHVELMHGMQMLERAERVSLVSMISILAAIMVSGNDADAASAILYGGAAGSTQAMINFTRTNEYEADRLGIELLKKSNYDPAAMASFLQKLQSQEQAGELSAIEFIRTHPIGSNRIAEILSRLANLPKSRPKPRRYQQFKDYLFYSQPVGLKFQTKTDFSQALDLVRNGQYEQAERIIRRLLQQDPDSLWFNSTLAEIMEFQQRLDEAVALYESQLLLYPDDLALGSRLVKVLVKQGASEQALKQALRLETSYSNDPGVYSLLVDIYDRMGNTVFKQLAEADYHWVNGNKSYAQKLYKNLLAEGGLDPAREARLSERLTREEQD
ncbi:MAG: M48 family metalloprotease [Gammaproteobacteria bacterium]|nr:M48 family metalloprotease [Gammaproteobacteria bacterium]